MAKRGRNQKHDNTNPKRKSRREYVDPADMDDDIDAFHKQRDVIPLDINDDDVDSSDDEVQPVFDYEDINADDDDDGDDDGDDKEDEDEDDDNDDDSALDTQLAAKIKRQQKYLSEKFGASVDEQDDEDLDDEDKMDVWGGKKHQYYGGGDYEGDSSDSDALKEEEKAIMDSQKKKLDTLSMEDFGIENFDDMDLTMEEISVKEKRKTKDSVIKDLNIMSRKEQMDVVYSSAPELVGLLSELNDALEQLETRVNPLLSKVKTGNITLEGGLRHLEVKQVLLLAYCQAITFYLLLKSEKEESVRDHPVIARLVEIKGLLEKMKPLDGNLPSEIEEFLKKSDVDEIGGDKVTENSLPAFQAKSVSKDYSSAFTLAEADAKEPAEPCTSERVKMESSKDPTKEKKFKRKTDQVGVQSKEMLKVRAELEEKLKQKGLFNSFAPKFDKGQKHLKSLNGQLETFDDFNDDAMDAERGNGGLSNGHGKLLGSSKLSRLVSAKANKPKAISGDDDLPQRDDIGERRRKHEMRVLVSAGVKSEDEAEHEAEPDTVETDDSSDMEDVDTVDLEDEFYKETKENRDAKLSAKAEKYGRNQTLTALPEIVDGKRHITRQIDKNRGLTRQRNKDLKNPRKKYRTKHDKQKKRWQGQVQQIRKPGGSYGGESTGINARISRSVRF